MEKSGSKRFTAKRTPVIFGDSALTDVEGRGRLDFHPDQIQRKTSHSKQASFKNPGTHEETSLTMFEPLNSQNLVFPWQSSTPKVQVSHES